MTGKPVSEMAGRKMRGNACYWRVVLELHRAQGTFTVSDVEQQTSAPRKTISDYLNRLLRAGILGCVGDGGGKTGQAKLYSLLKPQSDPPRVRRDGTISQGNPARDQMWRTAKILKQFSAKDLAIAASTEECVVNERDAKDYLKYLRLAGYLAILRPSKPGLLAVYRFLSSKNTGPRAPMVQRVKTVWDPNINKMVWGGDHDGDSA